MSRWAEVPCGVCETATVLVKAPRTGWFYFCPDCLKAHYENLARRLDPAYDPKRMNDWADCWRVLRRLWCWPPTDEAGETTCHLRAVLGKWAWGKGDLGLPERYRPFRGMEKVAGEQEA